MSMTEGQCTEIADQVLARLRPAMRVAIGDRTPRQYDRADVLAERLHSIVVEVLREAEDKS